MAMLYIRYLNDFRYYILYDRSRSNVYVFIYARRFKMTIGFKEFSIINRKRSESKRGFNHKLKSWSLSDWFVATMGELGEASNIVKKLNRYRDNINGNKETEDKLKQRLKAEIADTFIYLDLLCQREGIVLIDAIVETFDNKSIEIGYPFLIGKK